MMAEFAKANPFSNLKAISSLDGRFRGNIENYSDYFSEFATMKLRVELEINYLISIFDFLEKRKLSYEEKKRLIDIYEDFSDEDAEWLQDKDLQINHDTKSTEYFIREKLQGINFDLSNYVHIGITSADIDSNALVISIMRFENEVFAELRTNFLRSLQEFISNNKESVFLAKTHGKAALPTTMGKEGVNYLSRLDKLHNKIRNHPFEGKLTGAVGNFNALYAAYPDKNWKGFSQAFISKLGLHPNLFTTQILPYDNIAEYLSLITQFNNILVDLARDFWSYISMDLLTLKINKNEVGSSTMPHKVNPISFEGAEAYLLLSTNTLSFFCKELMTNRLQRDLTDKYLSREIGTGIVQAALGYSMVLGGVNNVIFNPSVANNELNDHWETLGEAVQTILRREGFSESYEIVKDLTRGKRLNKSDFLDVISALDGVSEETKSELRRLNPKDYIGWAKDI